MEGRARGGGGGGLGGWEGVFLEEGGRGEGRCVGEEEGEEDAGVYEEFHADCATLERFC